MKWGLGGWGEKGQVGSTPTLVTYLCWTERSYNLNIFEKHNSCGINFEIKAFAENFIPLKKQTENWKTLMQ